MAGMFDDLIPVKPPSAATPKAPTARAPSRPASSAPRQQGTRDMPIDLTEENKASVKPGEYFRFQGKVYQQKSGAGAPGAKPAPAPQYKTDPFGVAARGAMRSALPTLVGVGAGTAMGVATGLETGPGALVTGIAGGVIGGTAAYKAQEEYWKKHPNVARFMGQSPEQQAADIAAHKNVALVSEYAPGFLTGRPFTSAAPTKVGANIIQRGLASTAGRNAASGVVGGGFEAGRETLMGEPLDPKAIAIAAGAGATQGRGWGGTKLGGLRIPEAKVDTPLEREVRRTAPYKRTAPPSSAHGATLQAAGIEPVPLDVMPERQQHAVREASLATQDSRALAARYAADTTGALPSEGAPIVERLTPGDTRTTRQAEADVGTERSGAQRDVYGTPVRPGEATGEFARQAAQERETDRLNLDKTFDAARANGNVDLEVLDPNDPNSGWTDPTDEQIKEFGITEPSIINAKTSEVRPVEGSGPLGVAEIAAAMRTGTGSISRSRPGDVAGTLNVIDAVANKPYPTGEDFLGWRKDLTDLADSYRGQPEGNAARKARNALDEQIDALDAADRFLGDPNFVKGWRAGWAERRAFGTKWEGGSILETITEPRYVDGKWTTAIDPEVAANAIAGTGKQRGKIISNLNTVRDHVGADSPTWDGIRRELLQREMGFNPDDPNNVKKLTDWARNNPDVADILMTPADRAAVGRAEGTLAGTSGRESALKLGTSLLSKDTVLVDVTDAIGGMSNAQLRDARVAARQALRNAFDTPQASAEILSRVNSSPDVQAKIRALFGAEADELLRTAGALVKRYNLAESMTPPPLKGEITPIDVAAEAARAGARASPLGAASIVVKWIARTWRGISDAEAESIVRDALDPTKTEATKEFLRKRYGEGAAASIFGRIRSGLQHNEPGMRVIRRGLVPLAGPDVTTPEQEDKKEAPAPKESETAPVSNKGMFDDLIPPPPPPTAEDEARGAPVSAPLAGEDPEFDNLASRVLRQESKGNANAVSEKGATGLMQVMGPTGVDPGLGVEPLRNDTPTENLRFGRDYLHALIDRYCGDKKLALMAYNWGLGNVDDWRSGKLKDNAIPAETRGYVKNILGVEV